MPLLHQILDDRVDGRKRRADRLRDGIGPDRLHSPPAGHRASARRGRCRSRGRAALDAASWGASLAVPKPWRPLPLLPRASRSDSSARMLHVSILAFFHVNRITSSNNAPDFIIATATPCDMKYTERHSQAAMDPTMAIDIRRRSGPSPHHQRLRHHDLARRVHRRRRGCCDACCDSAAIRRDRRSSEEGEPGRSPACAGPRPASSRLPARRGNHARGRRRHDRLRPGRDRAAARYDRP